MLTTLVLKAPLGQHHRMVPRSPHPLPVQRWTTVPALAAWMGVSQDTVRGWVKRGVLPALRLPRCHYTDERVRTTGKGQARIYEADLVAFLRTYKSGPTMTIPLRILRRDY